MERPRAGASGRMLAGSRRGGRGDTRIQRKGHSSVCGAGFHTAATPSMLCFATLAKLSFPVLCLLLPAY